MDIDPPTDFKAELPRNKLDRIAHIRVLLTDYCSWGIIPSRPIDKYCNICKNRHFTI